MQVTTSAARASRRSAPDRKTHPTGRPSYPYPDTPPLPTNFHTLHISRSLLMSDVVTAENTSTDPAAPAPTSASAEAIRTWLTERVAYFLDLAPEEVAPDDLLVEIGLDSVYALTLCGDVEDEFGILVEATLAWDHPTVDALTAHIHTRLGEL